MVRIASLRSTTNANCHRNGTIGEYKEKLRKSKKRLPFVLIYMLTSRRDVGKQRRVISTHNPRYERYAKKAATRATLVDTFRTPCLRRSCLGQNWNVEGTSPGLGMRSIFDKAARILLASQACIELGRRRYLGRIESGIPLMQKQFFISFFPFQLHVLVTWFPS